MHVVWFIIPHFKVQRIITMAKGRVATEVDLEQWDETYGEVLQEGNKQVWSSCPSLTFCRCASHSLFYIALFLPVVIFFAKHNAYDADVAESFYNLATDFYEYGWGDSFHFGFRRKGEPHVQAIKNSQNFVATQLVG